MAEPSHELLRENRIAVPVWGPNDEVIAALNCLGQVELTPDLEASISREAVLAAGELTRRLSMMGD